MITFALGSFSASLTGRRERTEMRDIEGELSAYERTAAPAVPVAPVRMMCAIGGFSAGEYTPDEKRGK